MTEKAVNDLIGNIPHSTIKLRGYSDAEPFSPIHTTETRDLLYRLASRVHADSYTELKTADGTSGSTIAIYRINLAAGALWLGGIFKRFAALTDQVILGSGAWANKSLTLAGGTPAALTADGKTYEVALVAVLISGVPTIYAVFGAEAADGAEVAPTKAQIQAALEAKNPTGLGTDVGMVIGRFKVKRVATDTISMVHLDPATDDTLAADRGYAGLWGVSA